MTPEPTAAPRRQPRPGPAARRRALGLEPQPAAPLARESLTASLARIPDIERGGDQGVALAAPVAPPAPTPADAPAEPELRDDGAEGPASSDSVDQGSAEESAVAAPEARLRKGRIAPPPRPSWWRRIVFAVLLVGLVASIPVLGYAGYQVIEDSTDGTFTDGSLAPTDPGFEAKVDPTPTAVAIQYEDGVPNAVTFLALGGADGGGTVAFIPLTTAVVEPAFGVGDLATSYLVAADRPSDAREQLASQVGRLLNVGIEEIIDLSPEGWTQLVAPVAPLEFDNPDALVLDDGTLIPVGRVALAAEQVAPYLAARNEGESDLNRLNRHALLWSAWLDAVAASGRPDAVPGETSAGISRFATALAAGPTTYQTIPVAEDPSAPGQFLADNSALAELVTEAVPSPTAAEPGSRFTVRLLNGVSPSAIPAEVVRQIVSRGGAVTTLGNGPEFDQDETLIVYADPEMEDIATVMATALGSGGETRLDREAPDAIDLTIVLGRDVLGDDGPEGTPGATTPETAGGN